VKQTPFLELALVCEEIEKTSKRKEIARMLGDFIRAVSRDEITMVVNLLLGRIFPEWDTRSLNVSVATVLKVIGRIAKLKEGDYNSVFSEAVDIGQAVKTLFERGGFATGQKRTTVTELFHIFEEIARVKGPSSRKKKEEILFSLLSMSSPLEAKYIVKNAVGEMRYGVDEGMVMEALSRTLDIPINRLKRANMLTGCPWN
jgi:DNA ligase-1